MSNKIWIGSICLFFLGMSLPKSANSTSPFRINDDVERISVAKSALLLKDATSKYTLEDIFLEKELPFDSIKKEIQHENFTNSAYWIKLSLENNHTELTDFLLRVARPITNQVVLYEIEDNVVMNTQRSGDNYNFAEKAYPHRENLFTLSIPKQTTKQYLLYLKSDGEVLTLPMEIWTVQHFALQDYHQQYGLGLYYGILIFVALIFLFFFFVVRRISFLYYALYVFSLGLLQFSLDGFSFQYFFFNNAWWADHIVLISAHLGVIFVLLYARSFMQLQEHFFKLSRFFLLTTAVVAISLGFSFVPGLLYRMSFPAINMLSLLSILLIIGTVLYLRKKGHRTNFYFTAAFFVLIAGTLLFVFGNINWIENSALTQNALKIASAIEVLLLSFSMANSYRDLQREKQRAQNVALKRLEEMNQLTARINIDLEKEVAVRTKEIIAQKEEIAQKNKDVLDSIRYAKRIQEAILPPVKLVKRFLPNSFILYKPRDIVSGDFYWVATAAREQEHPIRIYEVSEQNAKASDIVFFAAVDCTGHGVPGAFMSIVGHNHLNQAATMEEVNSPAKILNYLHKSVSETLRMESNGTSVKDGMDISLCAVDKVNKKLEFSGAKNPIYIIRGNEIIEIKGDRRSIGGDNASHFSPFTNHEVDLMEGDIVYIFTDGFADQFGGPHEKKFKYSKFRELLLSIREKEMDEQRELLNQAIENWRGDLEQIDDICIIGVKISSFFN